MSKPRHFVQLLLESAFKEGGLQKLAYSLQMEKQRIDGLIAKLRPQGEDGRTTATQTPDVYRKEKEILLMEEKCVISQSLSSTADVHDASEDEITIT